MSLQYNYYILIKWQCVSLIYDYINNFITKYSILKQKNEDFLPLSLKIMLAVLFYSNGILTVIALSKLCLFIAFDFLLLLSISAFLALS